MFSSLVCVSLFLVRSFSLISEFFIKFYGSPSLFSVIGYSVSNVSFTVIVFIRRCWTINTVLYLFYLDWNIDFIFSFSTLIYSNRFNLKTLTSMFILLYLYIQFILMRDRRWSKVMIIMTQVVKLGTIFRIPVRTTSRWITN